MTAEERHRHYVRLLTSRRYRLLRAGYLGSHPLCEDCLEAGRVRAAEEVHHLRRVEGAADAGAMERRAMDRDNLRSLCRECHKGRHEADRLPPTKARTRLEKAAARRFASDFYGAEGGG